MMNRNEFYLYLRDKYVKERMIVLYEKTFKKLAEEEEEDFIFPEVEWYIKPAIWIYRKTCELQFYVDFNGR